MSRLPLAPAPTNRAHLADLFMQTVLHYRQGDHATRWSNSAGWTTHAPLAGLFGPPTHDPQAVAEIRSKLVSNRDRPPLFDTKRYCRHIEAAYEIMMQRYRHGERPESVAVSHIS
jgi:hypothetical protein